MSSSAPASVKWWSADELLSMRGSGVAITTGRLRALEDAGYVEVRTFCDEQDQPVKCYRIKRWDGTAESMDHLAVLASALLRLKGDRPASSNNYWKPRDSNPIKIRDMTSGHICRALRMLSRATATTGENYQRLLAEAEWRGLDWQNYDGP